MKKIITMFMTGIITFMMYMISFAYEPLPLKANEQNIEVIINDIQGMYFQTSTGEYIKQGEQVLRSERMGDGFIMNMVIKTVLSNGNILLDPLMKKYGYNNYTVEYYYENLDYKGEQIVPYSSYGSPVFILAVIDEREYRYYFHNDSMIRRIGPEGTVSDNPKTNEFLNQLYQVGRLYHNDMSDDTALSLNGDVIYFGYEYYDTGEEIWLCSRIISPDKSGINNESRIYIVDKNTAVSDLVHEEKNWYEGDHGYQWLSRHFDTEIVDGGYAGSLECFEVDTTGNHVDVFNGVYATH